jgi:type IV secretion system protein TrbL
MSVRFRRTILKGFLLVAAVAALAGVAAAQSAPSAILQQFQAVRNQWFAAVAGAANTLFISLAMIEFAWSAALLLLEKTDLQGFTAGVVRRLMFIGGFYALLQFGTTWIPAIIDSFELLGQQASGAGPLAPSAVFGRGLDIAGNLFQAASQAGFFQNMGTALALVFAAMLAFLAFVGITIQFVIAMVESYIVVAAGFIFLGFGGSRWTAPYVERYIALAVAVGVKILVLYLLIAGGMQVSADWTAVAAAVANQADPAMSAWDIAGGALIFLVLCWQAPKLISGILGGSPALTGGDLISTTGAIAVGGFALAGSAAAGVAWASRAIAAQGAAMAVGAAAEMGSGGTGGTSSPASGGSGGQADMSGGLEAGRVPPPAEAESTQSRVGASTARAGNALADALDWTGGRFRKASSATGKAKFVIPNDTPPPAPPPPPAHPSEQE